MPMAYPLAPFAPITGLRDMVSAADHLASTAGLGLLARGGSAADAAVGAAAVMAVTSPYLCGMGGDMLAVISAPGADPIALLATGRAGSGVDASTLRAEGHSIMPVRGDFRTVPVPGAVDGWLALHARFGRLALADVFGPAIELAEDGFVASLMLSLASHLVYQVPGAQELCPDGPVPLEARVRLPSVARTLRAIVDDGREGFYGGEFGRELVAFGEGRLRGRRSGPRLRPVVRAVPPTGLGARSVDRPRALPGLPHARQLVDRRTGGSRDRSF